MIAMVRSLGLAAIFVVALPLTAAAGLSDRNAPVAIYLLAVPSELLAETDRAPSPTDNPAEQQARHRTEVMLKKMDANGDHRIEWSEFRGKMSFMAVDKNHDNILTVDEIEAFFEAHPLSTAHNAAPSSTTSAAPSSPRGRMFGLTPH